MLGGFRKAIGKRLPRFRGMGLARLYLHKDAARPGFDFIYTKIAVRPGLDFIYTKISACPGWNEIQDLLSLYFFPKDSYLGALRLFL